MAVNSLKRGLRIVVVAGIIFLFGSAVNWFGIFQPRYQGHTATYWLDHLIEEQGTDFWANDNPPVWGSASVSETAARFRAMGPRAIDLLGRLIASKRFLERDSITARRNAAWRVLEALGPDAAPALPGLVRVFHNTNDTEMSEAAWVMAKLPRDKLQFLLPDLVSNLTSSSPSGWREISSIYILIAIGPGATNAVPPLWQLAKTGAVIDKPLAAAALWNIVRATNALVDCASNALNTHARDFVAVAANLEQYCEPLPEDILPVLEKALRHPEPAVRSRAIRLLAKDDPERLRTIAAEMNQHQDELLQAHLHLLGSTDPLDRWNAARALPFFGEKAVVAAPRLAEILGLPRPPRTAPGVMPRILSDDKAAALAALKYMGSNAASMAPMLTPYLTNNELASEVCDVLAAMGPAAATEESALQPMLGNRDSLLQFPAAQALAAINPSNTTAIEVLKSKKRVTGKLPGRFGRFGDNHIPSDEAMIADVLLCRIGVDTNSPVDELLKYAVGHDEMVAVLLGEIGPPARGALPVLEKKLKDKNSYDFSAALAIMKIDPAEAKRIGLPGLLILCPEKY
jgi:HEAT repeat protein